MLTPNIARGKRTRRGGGGQCTGPSQLGPQVVGVKDAGGKGNSPVPQPVGTGRGGLPRLGHQASSLWSSRATDNKLQGQCPISPPHPPGLPREIRFPPTTRLGLGLVKSVSFSSTVVQQVDMVSTCVLTTAATSHIW